MKFKLAIQIVLVLISFSLKNTSADSQQIDLKKILNYNSKTPLIAILYKHKARDVSVQESDSDVIVPTIKPVEPPHDQELYNFYHMLRTTQENEEVDSDAALVFEKTENILRQALRARCNRLDLCVQKCPVTIKFTCTVTCKEEYDDYNMCEKPKKPYCKKPRCGKTMPPAWLLKK